MSPRTLASLAEQGPLPLRREIEQVIVVGGAVAGAAMANALGSRGVPTVLVEKLERERHGARGDLLHPPTLAILDEWGALAALHADGALPLRELVVTHAPRGVIARYPAPVRGEGPAGRTIAVPHDRIEAVLYACAERWPSVRVQHGVVAGLIHDGGRVAGVRVRDQDGEREIRGRAVIGCDGTRSVVRRALGIAAEERGYERDFLYVEADGDGDPSAAIHWHLDEQGVLCVIARPNDRCRVFLTWPRTARPFGPDPALREHVVSRFPTLARLRMSKAESAVYRVVRLLAERFAVPGCALVGDAAHTTHPAGATGMSLAISGAARLAALLVPALERDGEREIDHALRAYDEERRPAAARALQAAHEQALRLYDGELFRDADAFARAIDPSAAWTAGGGGWGQDPAGTLRATQDLGRS